MGFQELKGSKLLYCAENKQYKLHTPYGSFVVGIVRKSSSAVLRATMFYNLYGSAGTRVSAPFNVAFPGNKALDFVLGAIKLADQMLANRSMLKIVEFVDPANSEVVAFVTRIEPYCGYRVVVRELRGKLLDSSVPNYYQTCAGVDKAQRLYNYLWEWGAARFEVQPIAAKQQKLYDQDKEAYRRKIEMVQARIQGLILATESKPGWLEFLTKS